jgi:hypothetical protein
VPTLPLAPTTTTRTAPGYPRRRGRKRRSRAPDARRTSGVRPGPDPRGRGFARYVTVIVTVVVWTSAPLVPVIVTT